MCQSMLIAAVLVVAWYVHPGSSSWSHWGRRKHCQCACACCVSLPRWHGGFWHCQTCVSQCLAYDKLDKHLSHLRRCSKTSMAPVSWRTGVCKLLIINHYWKWTLLQLLLSECWGYELCQVFVSVHKTWAKQAQLSKILGNLLAKLGFVIGFQVTLIHFKFTTSVETG